MWILHERRRREEFEEGEVIYTNKAAASNAFFPIILDLRDHSNVFPYLETISCVACV